MRSTSTVLLFIFVMALTVFSVIVVWPSTPYRYLPGHFWPDGQGIKVGDWERETMSLGLDLRGGAYLALQAEPPADYEGNVGDAVASAKSVIERRINSLGVSEAEVSTASNNRLVVQIPGVTEAEAREQVGRTARLEFRVFDDGGEDMIPATGVVDGKTLTMSGEYLKNNTYPQRIGTSFAVAFETTGTGSKILEQITQRAMRYPTGDPRRQMLIYLDEELISAAEVQDVISSQGVITGQESFGAAGDLSNLLNSGALPVPLRVIQSQEVSATLGQDSVEASVHAGEIGLLAVMLFMILYYRLPGVLASAALVTYTATTLMVFKLWPVTLTLSGIAAFVLSVGMAVDANILIFERMKEELRRGRTLNSAIDIGFRRAWTSIRDSNVSTLITCAILYWFGDQFGATVVKGFALTLAIGVGVSMFSAITVTRTFLKMVVGTRVAKNHWVWNAEETHQAPARGRAAASTAQEG